MSETFIVFHSENYLSLSFFAGEIDIQVMNWYFLSHSFSFFRGKLSSGLMRRVWSSTFWKMNKSSILKSTLAQSICAHIQHSLSACWTILLACSTFTLEVLKQYRGNVEFGITKYWDNELKCWTVDSFSIFSGKAFAAEQLVDGCHSGTMGGGWGALRQCSRPAIATEQCGTRRPERRHRADEGGGEAVAGIRSGGRVSVRYE